MEATSDGDAGDRRPWQSYHTVYTNAKAGMDGVDKQKVQKVIYEMSKGSKYFENERRKEALIRQKISNLRAQYVKLTDSEVSHFQMIADKKIMELEASRDLTRTWLHVDMDAFYAAVEMLDNPALKGRPLAVGNMSMICTANYEARKFGVRAAMPGFIGRKLCPDLIFVPTDFKKYTHYSELTRRVFSRYDPSFLAASLDEAYLDVTDVCSERCLTGEEIAEELRASVHEGTGLTCSAGVAPNRMLAKVCSDIKKPNGQFILLNDRMAVKTFISSLPIRKVGGIGNVTEHVLRDVLGINTCEEMLQKSSYICALFSSCSADFFISIGLGLGHTDHPQARSRKSISCERTFSTTADEALIFQKVADIAESLAADMAKESLSGRTLTLKLKTETFEVRSRALTLGKSINSKEDILSHACKLLKVELPLSVRLIGLRMSHFGDEKFNYVDPTQKTLMDYVTTSGTLGKVTITSNMSVSSIDDDREVNFQNRVVNASSPAIIWNLSSHGGLLASDHLLDVDGYEEERAKIEDNGSDSHITWSNGSNTACVREVITTPSIVQSGSSNIEMADGIDKCFYGQKVQEFWLEDYKCCVCGFELPPCFKEERQNHFDFHLAEKLQKEELKSNGGSSTQNLYQKSTQNLSSVKKDECPGKTTSRKKQKASPEVSKSLTIDSFFNKRSV